MTNNFLLIDCLLFGGGARGCLFEIGHSRSRGWKNFGRRWTKEWGVLKTKQFHGRHMCIIPNRQSYDLRSD